MNMKMKDIIIIIVAVALSILYFIFNYNSDDFMKASCMDIVTIWYVGILTIYVSEFGSEQRREKASIDHVIDEIDNFISNDIYFTYEYKDMAYIKQTSCANRIKYLKDANFNYIQTDIQFIDTHFDEIRNLYSNHIHSKESFENVKKDIDKHREEIEDKCIKIRIGLCK